MTRDRFLSDAELERFIAAVRERKHVNQPRDHALFALLANTGMRPSEALALRGSDLHLSARPPWIYVRRIARKHRPAPVTEFVLHKVLAAVVARYAGAVRPAELLFPFTRRQAQRLFHYYCRRAGLQRRPKIYALRHTVGMRLWRATRDMRLIQGLMGHARMKATAVYAHVSPQEIRKALELAATG